LTCDRHRDFAATALPRIENRTSIVEESFILVCRAGGAVCSATVAVH
jgi:hypothetical protein